jgi:hypothetical protein
VGLPGDEEREDPASVILNKCRGCTLSSNQSVLHSLVVVLCLLCVHSMIAVCTGHARGMMTQRA